MKATAKSKKKSLKILKVETIRDLSGAKQKNVKGGGAANRTNSYSLNHTESLVTERFA